VSLSPLSGKSGNASGGLFTLAGGGGLGSAGGVLAGCVVGRARAGGGVGSDLGLSLGLGLAIVAGGFGVVGFGVICFCLDSTLQ